ncbi:MAG: DUF58 domain-containing protein [Actinomycetota bacterium]|nr:DUF58 domain-containing protein [Actinomycetota bacterium]
MPTTRGWAALGAGVALIVLWVVFGERLMLGVGLFLALAIGSGVAYVRSTVPSVAVSRLITPFQVHDGDRAIVEVTLSTSRRIPQAIVIDEVSGLGTARFVADRVEPRNPMIARYEILCRPRGIYTVGPAIVQVRDPLALSEAGGTAGKTDHLAVYPAVEDLDGLPLGRGHDPTVNTSRSSFSPTGGEDFFTLREYQLGDDLRKVHWPSTAKRDELMIRQLEIPWQTRALVLLDPRVAAYPDSEMFEHAVRGAASVFRHLFRNGFTPTLWTGTGSGAVVGSGEGYGIAMEELAAVQPAPVLDLVTSIARLRRTGATGGVLILVTGVPDDPVLGMYRLLGKDFYRTVVMSSGSRADDALVQFARAGATVVSSPSTEPWASAWKQGMERTWSTATAG